MTNDIKTIFTAAIKDADEGLGDTATTNAITEIIKIQRRHFSLGSSAGKKKNVQDVLINCSEKWPKKN